MFLWETLSSAKATLHCDETETKNRKGIPYNLFTKTPQIYISCKVTIESPSQHCTFVKRPVQNFNTDPLPLAIKNLPSASDVWHRQHSAEMTHKDDTTHAEWGTDGDVETSVTVLKNRVTAVHGHTLKVKVVFNVIKLFSRLTAIHGLKIKVVFNVIKL